VSPSSAFSAEPDHDRGVVAGELVQRQQLADFHLDELQQLLVVDHVRLVHEHDDVRHADLARQQDVLARLRHRAIGRRHHQDRTVHLRRARDHVLHVVGMPRAVHVRVVTLVDVVFHVRRRDRDAARLLFRRLVDLVVRHERAAVRLRHHLRQRRRQRRLAMVDMTNRADVHVRLASLKFLFGHDATLWKATSNSNAVDTDLTPRPGSTEMELTSGIEPLTSSLPRTCSTD
jgi:hypothetical protein